MRANQSATNAQMVRRAVNSLYFDMIKRFSEKTGVSFIMNTSFDLKRDPVIKFLRGAVRIFYSSGLDAPVIGSFLIER